MGKLIAFEFNVNDQVKVLPLKAAGTVTGLLWFGNECKIRVRYFYDGYVRYEDFLQSELQRNAFEKDAS